jgi:hypothetical protein
MKSYSLRVYRGSNTLVPSENAATGNTVDGEYNPIDDFRYMGTIDKSIGGGFPDSDRWVLAGDRSYVLCVFL